MISATTTHVVVRLAVGSDPITGHVIDLQDHVRPFTGWVELTHAVEEAVRERPVPSSPRNRRPTC
jgi:hypothetical protein